MSETLFSFISLHSHFLGEAEQWIIQDTLLSKVFIGKDKVFKFKKPIRLSYVDQSTPELRFSLCQTEITTNQMFNENDYLNILGFYSIQNDSMETFENKKVENFDPLAVDFCIVMNRLPNEAQWEHCLEKNIPISKADILSLCEKIHSHHLIADPERYAEPWIVWEESFERLIKSSIDFPRDLLHSFQDSLLNQKPLLRKLVQKGYWREGHGDLRADHIYSQNSIVSVLDCVEFNKDYRITNTFEDLAFLYLGFLYHNREDLGFFLLQSIFFFRPDPRSLEIFFYFVWQKACVRWYVNSLKEEKNQIHIRIYEHLIFRFVEALSIKTKTSPSLKTPSLTLVIGLPGSGKTTRAKEIAESSKAFLISLDNLRKFAYRIPPYKEASSLVYTGFRSRWIYRKALAVAKRLLELGFPVIVDGTFLKKSHRDPFLQMARSLGHPWSIVECKTTLEETKERLDARKREPSISDLKDMSIWDRMRREWEPVLQTSG